MGASGISGGVLTVCVDDEFQETTFASGGSVTLTEVAFPGTEAGDRARAVLVMPDGRRYEDETEAVSYRPNGPGCGPECIDADLTLTGT